VRDGHDGTGADAHSVAVAISKPVAKPDGYPVAVAIAEPVTYPIS
jgi:hypothetical protein